MRIQMRSVVMLIVFAVATHGVFAPAAWADNHGKAESTDAGTQKAVLVTGASTGIGRRITEVLAERGVFVYAGARKDKDLKELDAMKNVKAILDSLNAKLDGTDVQIAIPKPEGFEDAIQNLMQMNGMGGGF